MRYQFQPTCQIPPETLDKIYVESFGFKKDGVFVEFGAHDGWHWSCSWGLAEIGWRGIYAEPEPKLFKECCATNAKRPNVSVMPCCIGKEYGVVTLGVGEYGASADSKENRFSVEQYTLDEFLQIQQVPKRFDLLVIDVEGSELDVLAGFTLSTWQPKLIIIERQPDLKLDGYEHIYSDWINDIFRRTT